MKDSEVRAHPSVSHAASGHDRVVPLQRHFEETSLMSFGASADTLSARSSNHSARRDPCVLRSFLYRPASHAVAACRTWMLRCLQAPQPKVSSMSIGRQTVTSGGDATPAASMN